MTETDILVKFKKGDLNAFKWLYEKYFELILYYITGLVYDKLDAEDLTEELFLHLWEKRESITIRKSFKNYLISSAHNRAINYLNSLKTKAIKRQEVINEDTEIFSEKEIRDIADSHILTQELRKQIIKSIDNLPHKCRKIFKLNRLYNYKYDQIAEKLGVSVSTVEKQISKALMLLRINLKDYLPYILIVLSVSFI